MSAYVKKIQFKLHESYGNPLRGTIYFLFMKQAFCVFYTCMCTYNYCSSLLVVTKPPYEITETGWGEFEIIIKIFFIDPNERPVSILIQMAWTFLISYHVAKVKLCFGRAHLEKVSFE